MATLQQSLSDGNHSRMRIYLIGLAVVMAFIVVFYGESLNEMPSSDTSILSDDSKGPGAIVQTKNTTHVNRTFASDTTPEQTSNPTRSPKARPTQAPTNLPTKKTPEQTAGNRNSSNNENDALIHNESITDTGTSITDLSESNTSSASSSVNRPLHQTQITNFRNGQGLLLNIHFTHHAGTFMCGQFKQYFKAPPFACMDMPRRADWHNYTDNQTDRFHKTIVPAPSWTRMKPWNKSQTHDNIRIAQQEFGFRFVSQEYGYHTSESPLYLNNTNWEHPHLVSAVVVRNPIERMLAGDAFMNREFGKEEDRQHEDWWRLANLKGKHSNYVDNFNLFLLSSEPGCCSGNATDPIHLASAKEQLSRFTYILDQACLDKGVEIMAAQLGISSMTVKSRKRNNEVRVKSPSERIGFTDVYDFLVDKNRLDIELYEWAKTQSLVRCDH